jgi:hypothetical protein
VSEESDQAAIGRYAKSFDEALGKVVDRLQPEAVRADPSILASLSDDGTMLADTLLRRLRRLGLPEGHADVIKQERAIKMLLDPPESVSASDRAQLKAGAFRGHETIKRVLAARRKQQG